MARGRPSQLLLQGCVVVLVLAVLVLASKMWQQLARIRGGEEELAQPHSCSIEHLSRVDRAFRSPGAALTADGVWARVDGCKQRLPKDDTFRGMTVQQLQQRLPVWVLSVKRADQRRAWVMEAMRRAGIADFSWVDGIDGAHQEALTAEEVDVYFGGREQARLWREGDARWRRKVAVDISHYRMYQRIIAANQTAIIFEDDGGPSPGGDWHAQLLAALQDLPRDWDVLFLNACLLRTGAKVSARLEVVHSGHCTLAYVPTVEFARKWLAEAKVRKPEAIDVMFDRAIVGHEINAYIANPRLAVWGANLKSIVDERQQTRR